jgi:D-tyrosyl-tRNA(Tyr) deacylase
LRWRKPRISMRPLRIGRNREHRDSPYLRAFTQRSDTTDTIISISRHRMETTWGHNLTGKHVSGNWPRTRPLANRRRGSDP